MPMPRSSEAVPGEPPVAVGVRAAYDAVARAYDAQLGNELDGKPLDRALLDGFVELAGAGTIADVGEVNHLTQWFGEPVNLDTFFLEPDDVVRDLVATGFAIMSTVVRQPWPDVEYPSRRSYILAQRR